MTKGTTYCFLRDEMGAAIHAALRKNMDSSLSSLLWSLVNGLEGEWLLFLARVESGIKSGNLDISSKDAFARSFAENLKYQRGSLFEETPSKFKKMKISGGLYNALVTGFEMLAESRELAAALAFCWCEDNDGTGAAP